MNLELIYQILCKIFIISTIVATFGGALILFTKERVFDWLWEKEWIKCHNIVYEITEVAKKIYLSIIAIVLLSLSGILIFAIIN